MVKLLPLLGCSLKKFLLSVLVLALANSLIYSGIEQHLKSIDNKTEPHSYGPIDFVYLINLDHRPDKLQKSISVLREHRITPFRFAAVNGWKIRSSALQEIGMKYTASMRGGGMGSRYVWDGGKEYVSHELINKEGQVYFAHSVARGAIGCMLSHLSILKDAYDSGYEIIWILEDDIQIVRSPKVLISCIEELDKTVGRKNWDLLYTDRDYRHALTGEYVLCSGTDYRPDVDTRDQERFNIDKRISKNVRQIGSRFATTSIIWTRNGMQKYLNYAFNHGMFLPIDMDIHLAPKIKMYSVIKDVVTNLTNSISDNGRNHNNEKLEY